MSIYITASFIQSMFSLDKKMQKQTMACLKSLEENFKTDSLKIHKLDNCKCDNRFRSARVNDDVRIIFANTGNGDKALLYVDHHDAAYSWCEGKYLQSTNFGAQMLYDERLEASSIAMLKEKQAISAFFEPEEPLLMKQNIKPKHLAKLGIPEVHAQNLLEISDEDTYIDYVQIFSEELQEALISLAVGDKSFDLIYNELIDADYENGLTHEHKDTRRRFYLMQSLDELEAILDNGDFEAWTVFLHPSQEKLVRANYNGPALVEGGPGTGKTIVGIHRAVHLSQNVFLPDDGKKILFCTFSKKLARSIDAKLDLLVTQKGYRKSNIDVMGVDAYLRRLYINAYRRTPELKDGEIRGLLRNMYEVLKPSSGSASFYLFEYVEVIEKYNIKTLEEYLNVNRAGATTSLNRKQRETAWKFFSEFLKEKERRRLMSFVDMAHEVYRAIKDGKVEKEYDSVIIDEAQDLEPIKLRVLSTSVKAQANNVFILCDMNQRIFKFSSWKKESDINIVGRTAHLSINYRTTKQISDYARYQFVNSSIITDHIKEYKSIVNGQPPVVVPFKTEGEQKKYVAQCVKELMDTIPEEQICIICPTNNYCTAIESVLQFMDIPCRILEKEILPEPGKGVCICPIKGVKGLEFRAVILYNYDKIEGTQIVSSTYPAIASGYEKMAECAKYVAATRARDELIITYLEREDVGNGITI